MKKQNKIEIKIKCLTCKDIQSILDLFLHFSESNTQTIPKTTISGWFGNAKCPYCNTIYSVHCEAYKNFEMIEI